MVCHNFKDDQIVWDSNLGCTSVVQLQPVSRIFSQISNFDSLYFCSPLNYGNPQYLFGKVLTLLLVRFSVQEIGSILKIGFALLN